MLPEATEAMIPLHDDNPVRQFGWLTLCLILGNVAIFAYELTLSPEALADLLEQWAFVPSQLSTSGPTPLVAATIVTSAFIHAGWLHLGGNMLYLWVFGNKLEGRLGPVRFGAFYLLWAVAAALAQTIATPTSITPMVGASGAIAGILGAYLVLFPRARVTTIIPLFFYMELAALPAAFVIVFWFILQVAQGLTALGGTMESGVAWWAHIGGFVAGAALVIPMLVREKLKPRRTRLR